MQKERGRPPRARTARRSVVKSSSAPVLAKAGAHPALPPGTGQVAAGEEAPAREHERGAGLPFVWSTTDEFAVDVARARRSGCPASRSGQAVPHRRLQQPPRDEVRRSAWIRAFVAAALAWASGPPLTNDLVDVPSVVRPLGQSSRPAGTNGSGQAGQRRDPATRLRRADVARRRRATTRRMATGRSTSSSDQRAPACQLRRRDDRLGATPAAPYAFFSQRLQGGSGQRSGAAQYWHRRMRIDQFDRTRGRG